MKVAYGFPIRLRAIIFGVLLVITALMAAGLPTTHAKSVIHVPADHATIQGAVDAASPGDTIQVAAGTYAESVLIDSKADITLRGQQATLRGSKAGIGIKILDSDNIEIQGFTVERYRTGILLEGTDNSRIHNVETRYNDNPADKVGGSPNALLNNGLDLVDSHYNAVTNVFAHNNGHNGMTIKGGSTHNTLQGNTTNDNGINPDVASRPAGCGIQINADSNDNNFLIANEALRNAFGILVAGTGASGSTGNYIVQNRLHENDRVGIDVRDGSSNNFIGQNNAKDNLDVALPGIDLRDEETLDNTWRNNQGTSNF